MRRRLLAKSPGSQSQDFRPLSPVPDGRDQGPESSSITPELSVIVVAYDMQVQAMNTLATLTADYQRLAPERYEVLVVENESERMLDAECVTALGPNFGYLRRQEDSVSPCAAINAAVTASRGDYLAVLIDGARMLTPGVLRGLLQARDLAAQPVTAVPGYHLGDELHQDAARRGYSADDEQAWLAETDWQTDGYHLFRRAVLSASCGNGFLMPMAESNCVGVSRELFNELGGYDERFVSPGGGFVNLDFYRRAVLHRHSTLAVLPGEGAFHQFHGGASTDDAQTNHEKRVDAMRVEYRSLRGRDYAPPEVAGVQLGSIGVAASRFVTHSAEVLARKVGA